MSWLSTTSVSSIGASPKPVYAQDIMAVARAEQDWRDGLSIDENPFPPGTSEHQYYHQEFDRLLVEEAKRDLSAA